MCGAELGSCLSRPLSFQFVDDGAGYKLLTRTYLTSPEDDSEELLLEDVRQFINEEMAARFLDNRLDFFFGSFDSKFFRQSRAAAKI